METFPNFVVIGSDERIVYLNEGCARLLGATAKVAIGQDVSVVCNRIPIRRDGEIVGAVAATTISDLLDVARLNDEIKAIRSENQRYKAELEQMKSAMNPLNQVVGQSPAIRQWWSCAYRPCGSARGIFPCCASISLRKPIQRTATPSPV